jgi:putative aldouronate transport system substrate-binding protein
MAGMAACGGTNPSPQNNTTQAAEAVTANTAETTKAAETQAATTTAATEPLPDGALPTWLTMETKAISFLTHTGWSSDSPPPANDLPKYKELERLTNVHIDFEVIPVNELSSIVNVRLASGSDLPDMINYNAGIGRLPELVEDGLIIDQMEYWKNRYPYTHALINGGHPYSDPMYETLYDTMSINGVFYGATQIVPVKNMQVGLMVNKFWLEELKLQEPETVDEFVEMLTAFRDLDATGSGKTDDQIPLVTERYCLTVIANFFGLEYGGCANGHGLTAADGKLHFERTDDKYRAFIAYLNKLFKEKLLDADFMTTDRDSLNEYSATNKCGVINWWVQAMDSFSAYSPYSGEGYNIDIEVFKPMKPLKSGFGGGYLYNRRGGTGSMMLITTSCKNPELAADWIDFVFASPEGMDMVAYGILGESYEKNGDEIVVLRDDKGTWKRNAVGGGQQPHAYLEANNNYIYALAADWKVKAWESLLPYYKEGTLYNLALLPDETDIITDKCADLITYMDETYTSFILGTLDINDDAAWKEYVDTCDKLGLQVYMDNYQKAYDRKYGN